MGPGASLKDGQYAPNLKARNESAARRRVRFPSFSQVNACLFRLDYVKW